MKTNITLALSVIALIAAGYIYMSMPSYAYVNSTEVFEKYTASIEANKKIESENKILQANVNTLKNELDSIQNVVAANFKSWKKSKQEQMRNFVVGKQQEFQRYTQAVQQKAMQREQEIMEPVVKEIDRYIAKFAKENGYDMVFGTLQGNILFAGEAKNITEDVIAYLNNEY